MMFGREWQSTLRLKSDFDLYRADEISIKELGKRVSKAIKANKFYKSDDYISMDLEFIAEDFEEIESVNEFDDCLAALYDFGDINKRIWVDTR